MLAFVNARAIIFKRYAGYLKLLLKHAESMGFPITRNGCSPATPTFGFWRSKIFYSVSMRPLNVTAFGKFQSNGESRGRAKNSKALTVFE
jgi:hypothetical protein